MRSIINLGNYPTLFSRVLEWMKNHQAIGQSFAPIMLHGLRIASFCGDRLQIESIRSQFNTYVNTMVMKEDNRTCFSVLVDGYLACMGNQVEKALKAFEEVIGTST